MKLRLANLLRRIATRLDPVDVMLARVWTNLRKDQRFG